MRQQQQVLLHSLGTAIARRRMNLDHSQQHVAESAGVHRSYMSDVERGLRNITLATLESIAKALNTTSAELLLEAYEIKNTQIEQAAAQYEIQ